MNKVCITGRLVKDIEIRYTQNNVAVTQFTLAVTRKFKNANGDYESDFINCVTYRNTAEVLSKYTKKDDLIGIEGRIQTRNYENQEGKKVYVTEVIVESVDFLASKKEEKPKEEPVKQKLSDEVFSEFGSSIEIDESDIAF